MVRTLAATVLLFGVTLTSACSFTGVPTPSTGAPLTASDGGVALAPSADAAIPIAPQADGGVVACAPNPPAGQMEPWVAPARLHAGACTPSQVVMVSSWLGAYETNATLENAWSTFAADPVNQACLACAITPTNAPRGPAYGDETMVTLNVSGCIAALTGDSSNTGCGARSSELFQCVVSSCAHCDDDSYWACTDAAVASTCASKAEAEKCAPQNVWATCNGEGMTDLGWVSQLVTLFCGS